MVGAGLGGVPCAYTLRKLLGKEHRVTLIGSQPHFEFTPSNPWIGVGWRKPEDTRVELREPLERKGVQWIADTVTTIDAPALLARSKAWADYRDAPRPLAPAIEQVLRSRDATFSPQSPSAR